MQKIVSLPVLLLGTVQASFKMPGYIVSTWWHDSYMNSEPVFKAMAESGVKYVQIVITQYMNSISDTQIKRDNDRTPSDESVIYSMNLIRKYGMEPILKPHVDMYDGNWRGYIGNAYSQDSQWKEWFDSYSQFITYYAQLARDNQATYFNLGTELDATEAREPEWRAVIADVRAILPETKLWYGCNWWPNVSAVNFWDALDFIAVSAYYPLSNHINPSISELNASWVPIMETLQATSQKYNKKVIFSEIGYASFDQAPESPNQCCSGNPNLETQQFLFESFFESVWPQDWFAGVFWWSWDALNTSPNNPNTNNFEIFGKPAQTTLQNYYSKIAQPSEFLQ